MYNLRKVQLFEPHPHSVLARRKVERGMQMLVIFGALAMTAYAAGGYWLVRWLSQ